MNPTGISALIESLESEFQTADGRTIKVSRDANGNFWVIDDAERVMSLSEFASDLAPQARQLCERERAQAMRELVASVKRAVVRAVRALRPHPQPAHA
jgi:hypothetical protein